MTGTGRDSALEIRNLSVQFSADRLRPALVDVSLSVAPGTIMGMVGESGSGKSLLCRAVLGLLPHNFSLSSGSISVEGDCVTDLSSSEMRRFRAAKMGFIPQEPMAALNPVLTVGEQLAETIRLTGEYDRKRVREESVRLLESVHIPDPLRCLMSFPHENSGGMRQRILAAISLVGNPRIIIADEPTTALDATTQLSFLELLASLRDTFDCAVLLVTHNIRIVQQLCDDVAVMYGGRLVELGSASEVSSTPRHPYTRALLDAMPKVDSSKRLAVIPGSPPMLGEIGAECPFVSRCPVKVSACETQMPAPRVYPGGTVASCWVQD